MGIRWLFWFFMAAFFLFTYSPVTEMVDTSTTINEATGIIIHWLWIVFLSLFTAIGVVEASTKGEKKG